MRLVGIAFIIGIGSPNVAAFLAVYQSREYLTTGKYIAILTLEFARGLACSYDGDEQELVRVLSGSPGSKIAINHELAATIQASDAILGVFVKVMSKSFATTYYKAKGILPLESGHTEELGTRRSQSS